MVDFGNPDELRRWLGEQPRPVGIALAARSALRVLPMIGLPSTTAGTGPLLLADAIHVQTHFRLLSIAWAAFGQSLGDPWIAARARSAIAVSLPIGTLFANSAASAARRSAAEAARAVARSAEDGMDALVAAISEAYSAEAEFPDDAGGILALATDVEFLADRGVLHLARVPLWSSRPPAWAEPRWRDLKTRLTNAQQDWQVWTTWYDDRLAGKVNSIPREVAYVNVSNELWKQDPAAVNKAIIRRIEEREPPPRPILPPEISAGDQSTIVSESRPALDFSNREDVERWLADKPRDVAVVFAARAALRVAPLLVTALGLLGGGASVLGKDVILPVFRAIATPWVACQYPIDNAELRAASVRAVAYGNATAGLTAANAASGAARYASAVANAFAHGNAASAADAAGFSAASAAEAASAAGFSAANAASADAGLIDQGSSAAALAERPLWLTEVPPLVRDAWGRLQQALLKENPDWKVWTDWYRARLEGRPSDEVLEVARVMIADETWRQGPRAVNAEIARLIEDREVYQDAVEGLPLDNPAGAQNWQFFLSYSKDDLKFARWVERVLRAAGFSVFAQFNEMPPGSNFVREMQRGLAQSSRFIALLSPSYAKSDHCQAEWSAAYNADPGGAARKLVQLLIKPTDLPPLAKQIVYKHLIGLSAPDAAKAVLEAVGHRDLITVVPAGWPGGPAIDRMRAATGGIYEVAPGADLRLERVPAAVAKPRADAFTPEQLFADVASVVADFAEYTQKQTGNFCCSQRVRERAAKLREVSAVGLASCDPLTLNRSLVWVFRVISLDQADGLIPPNDEFEHHQKDLYGIYNQLERIFPKLKKYRRMNARDRFEPPSADAEEAIRAIYQSLGDPDVSENALSPSLSRDLKEAGESIEDAKNLAGERKTDDERADIAVEAHADAAARSLAVWGWLSNAQEKLVKSGKKADEVAKAVERYEKLYTTLSPLMVRYLGYLVRWFF
jgi:TIR domain-containing protein